MNLPDPAQHTALSADGTRIGFKTVGSGPVPLVVVHGALATGKQWMSFARAMTGYSTCYVMDRWGRGGSGNRKNYSLEREVDDIEAVFEAAGPGACLLGHSSGAIYALEAAARLSPSGLILYEPPLHAFHGRFVEETWRRIRAAADAERFEEVLAIFLAGESRLSREELDSLKTKPVWKEMTATAPQAVREWDELIRIRPVPERYRTVATRTLLLAGTDAHPSFATQALQDTLPNAQTKQLAGEGHFAHVTSPGTVAEIVGTFLLGASPDESDDG